jgi:alkylated DNA nucleotide flippase Atl1
VQDNDLPVRKNTMTKFEKGAQLWPVLAFAARNRQILTYGLVGQLIGVPAVAVGQTLGPIQSYCKQQKMPGLTAIVVHELDGLPGSGFTASELKRVFAEQAQVFGFNWLRFGPPSAHQLQDAHTKPDTASA